MLTHRNLDVAAKGGVIRSEYSILYGVISLIFLINAMQLSPEKLREHALNWRLHIVVQGVNLLIIPVIQLGKAELERTSKRKLFMPISVSMGISTRWGN